MKTLINVILVAFVLTQAGCMSYYNHNRVQNKIAERRILASGDKEAIKLVNSGVKPKEAIKIRILQNAAGQPDGAMISANLLNLGGWLETFKEAPISSTASILGDAALGYGIYYMVDQSQNNSQDNSEDSDVAIDNISGDGNTINIVNGDNNSSNNDDNIREESSTDVTGDSNYDTEN